MIRNIQILVAKCPEEKLKKYFEEGHYINEWHKDAYTIGIWNASKICNPTSMLSSFFEKNKDKLRQLNYDDDKMNNGSYPDVELVVSIDIMKDTTDLLLSGNLLKDITYTGIGIRFEKTELVEG